MEQKLVRVPFDVELAKKITNKEIDGKIVTADGRAARIADFNLKEEGYPLLIIAEDSDGGELYYSCALDGKVEHQNDSLSDLMLEIPEYLTFKDGDIYKTESGSIAIYNGNYQAIINNTPYYVGLRISDNKLIFQSNNYGFGIIKKCSLDVSESEKQKLIEALKASKEPKAKDCLKMLGVEVKPECEFKPKDWVLCKGGYSSIWTLCRFSHIEGNMSSIYVSVGGSCWHNCIPYNDQTKHLLGTTDNWEE